MKVFDFLTNKKPNTPTGNRTRGNCLEGNYVTITPLERRIESKTTLTGFEPARVEPNGFQVHRLNHSATVSLIS